MATTTSNYGFVKPDYADLADINVINNNMDKIDDAINNVEKKSENSLTSQFGSVEGREITLNSINGVALLESMDGESEQTTLTGNNLVKLLDSFTTYTNGNVTFTKNNDGTISVVGACNSNTNLIVAHVTLPVGTYIINGGVDGGSSSTYQMYVYSNNTQKNYYVTKSDDVTFAVEEEDLYTIRIYVYQGTTINAIFKPMIRKAEITDPTFEPYVGAIPSPNPDYPQPIESVGDSGSVEVVTCGRNLWNGTVVKRRILGNKLSVYDNAFYSILIPAEYGKVYTVSRGAILGTMFTYGFISKEPSEGITVYNATSFGVDKLFGTTIPTPENCKYLVVTISNSNVTEKVENTWYQIEVGDVVTPYEPYQESRATLTLAEPLRSLPNGVRDTIECNADGSLTIVRRVRKRILNGSEDWQVNEYYDNCWKTNRGNCKMSSSACCTHYEVTSLVTNPDIYYAFTIGGDINVRNKDITTVEELKTLLSNNPIIALYELETPTKETITAEQLAELLKLRTFEGVTYITTNDAMQPNMKFKHALTDVAAINSFNSSKLADINARLKALEG